MYPIVPIVFAVAALLRWLTRKGEEGAIRRTVPRQQLEAALAEMHERHAFTLINPWRSVSPDPQTISPFPESEH